MYKKIGRFLEHYCLIRTGSWNSLSAFFSGLRFICCSSSINVLRRVKRKSTAWISARLDGLNCVSFYRNFEKFNSVLFLLCEKYTTAMISSQADHKLLSYIKETLFIWTMWYIRFFAGVKTCLIYLGSFPYYKEDYQRVKGIQPAFWGIPVA